MLPHACCVLIISQHPTISPCHILYVCNTTQHVHLLSHATHRQQQDAEGRPRQRRQAAHQEVVVLDNEGFLDAEQLIEGWCMQLYVHTACVGAVFSPIYIITHRKQ